MRPALNVRGIAGGDVGERATNSIPTEATASIDFRLVPDQTPEEILEKVKAHLKGNGFGDLEVAFQGGLNPSRTPVDHPYVQTVVRAVRNATGKEPIVSPSMGGSGPDYIFTGVLGLPSVWLPLSPHDSNNHAPNESIFLEGFFEAIKISASVMQEMASY